MTVWLVSHSPGLCFYFNIMKDFVLCYKDTSNHTHFAYYAATCLTLHCCDIYMAGGSRDELG